MFILCLLFTCLLGLPLAAQTTTTETLTVNGVTRTYVLYVPATYTAGTAVPLLFNFHGYTGNASQQLAYGDFRPIADTEGFLIAAPQGLDLPGTASNDPHWNVGGWTLASQSDDLGFTDAMIAEISTNYNIDTRRIYSTGFSNGGFLSFELACRRSNVIAAVGSVAGTLTPQQESAGCTPARPVPVVQIHGTSDATIPYGVSSGYSEPVSDAVDLWRGYNGASVAVAPVSINTNATDGTTVDYFRYETPAGASLVEHYRVNSGAHRWPGSAFNQSGTSYDIDAARVVWNFVSQFSLPAALPVVLTRFTVAEHSTAVALAWTSATEQRAARYVIERRGAADWEELGNVAARNRPSGYTFLDEAPQPGTGYYRLRMEDWDGHTEYSDVRTVTRTDRTDGPIVYPNPARSEVTVSAPKNERYQLYSALGELVLSGRTSASLTTFRVAQLPAGNYTLQVGNARARLVLVK